ncbi:hypothetical protein MRX96_010400 [Rhipicephalus microplus]
MIRPARGLLKGGVASLVHSDREATLRFFGAGVAVTRGVKECSGHFAAVSIARRRRRPFGAASLRCSELVANLDHSRATGDRLANGCENVYKRTAKIFLAGRR